MDLKVEVIREAARDILEKTGMTVEDIRKEDMYIRFQIEVIQLHASNELRARKHNADVIICDRTIYDSYIYTVIYQNLIGYNDELVYEFIKLYNIYKKLCRYNIIFLLNPITNGKTTHGIRGLNPPNPYLYNILLSDVLRSNNETFTVLSDTDIDARVNQVISSISLLG